MVCAKKPHSLVRRLQLPFRHAQAHDKYIPNYACLNNAAWVDAESSGHIRIGEGLVALGGLMLRMLCGLFPGS